MQHPFTEPNRVSTLRLVVLVAGLTLMTPCLARPAPYSVLVVEEMLGRVTILDSDAPQRRVSVPVGFKPHEAVVSPDGKTVYVGNFGLNDANNRDGIAGATITAVDIASAAVRAELRLPDPLKAPHGLGFRPGHGVELYTNAEQGERMVVFDADSGRVTRTFPLPAGIHNFVFSKTGADIFAFAPTGAIYRLDAATGRVKVRREMGGPVRGLVWTSDGHHLLASVRGAITVVDAETLATTRKLSLPATTQPFYCAATPDGRWVLAPSVFDGEVTVFDAHDGTVIRRLHTGTPLRVVMAPDADLAYVGNVSPRGTEVSVIHVSTFEITHIVGLRDVNGLAFSPILPAALRRPPS